MKRREKKQTEMKDKKRTVEQNKEKIDFDLDINTTVLQLVLCDDDHFRVEMNINLNVQSIKNKTVKVNNIHITFDDKEVVIKRV